MAKSATLTVKDGQIRGSINALLKDLLDKQAVEAVLVPLVHPAGNNVVQSLVTNPEYLEQADVFAPVMPVNAGRIIQAMTRLTPANKKTAVVMRPCELRALVELVKLRQAQLDNLYLIGIDCPGAYSVSDYPKFAPTLLSGWSDRTSVKSLSSWLARRRERNCWKDSASPLRIRVIPLPSERQPLPNSLIK